MAFTLDIAWSILIVIFIALILYVSVFMYPNTGTQVEDNAQVFKVDRVTLLREMS